MLSAIIAIVAVFMAYQARNRARELQLRLSRVEETLDRVNREISDFLRSGKAPPDGMEAPSPSPALAPPEPKPDAKPTEAAAVPQIGSGEGQQTSVPPTGGPSDAGHPSGPGLEERLGTRWAVWAGGLALALGGLLLVRFSIEAGLIGPEVRIALGTLLAASLIAGGEYLRRSEARIPIQALPEAHVPSILTAAGTVVAFGTIYAAHALYDFIGPAAAFVLLGATALLTMLAAAVHGPWLAGIGIAGAYLTPLLVSSQAPNPWPVVLYLTAVSSAAFALARSRSWLWLAWTAVGGAVLWGFLLAGGGEPDVWLRAAAAHALIQLALAALFLAIGPHSERKDGDSVPDIIASVALAALAAVVALVLASHRLDIVTREIVAAAGIAILGLTAWRAAPAAVAAALAGTLGLVLQLSWPGLALPADPTLTAPAAERLLRLPENISAFLMFSALASVVPAVLAGLRLWRGPMLPVPTAAIYAAGMVVPPLLALILAYLRVTQFDTSIPFAFAGAALALAFGYCAERFHRADIELDVPAYNIGAGALAAGAIAALAFAFFACLERGYLTVVLALTALGTAYVATKRDIPVLRYAVGAIGFVVLGRVLWDPRIMGDGVGTTPIFNWLLVGYGVPAVAFALSARWLERLGDTLAVRLSDGLAVTFTALLAFFEIRHLTNGGDVLAKSSNLVEMGLLALTSILLSYVLARLNNGKRNPVFDVASLVFGGATVAIVVVGLFVFQNPVLTGDRVEAAYGLNGLTLSYLLPGIAALFVARHARGIRPPYYVRAAGVTAVALIFAYVSLEVRRAFHGPGMSLAYGTTDAEQWSYSAAWLLLGVAFLGYGLLRGSLEARIASAALIVLSALKVTLYDLAGIGGLWRALSFLCLGAVLIGIGLVYQRLIFAKPPPSPPKTA